MVRTFWHTGTLEVMALQTSIQKPKFGELLRAHRQKAGLTVTQLADRVGLDQSHVSKIELGDRNPPRLPYLLKMAQELGIAPNSNEWRELFKEAARGQNESIQVEGITYLGYENALHGLPEGGKRARSAEGRASPPVSPRVLRHIKIDSPEYKALLKGTHENPPRHAEDSLQAIAMAIDEIKKHGVRRIMIEDEDEIIHDIYVGNVEVPPHIVG